MPARQYLPSAKLVYIVLSLALSVGLVFAADHLTRPPAPAQVGVDATPTQPANTNWEAALYAVQAQSSTATSTAAAPDQTALDALLQAAQGPNITESIGKSLLINLTNAKTQGLGDDIPTQNQILDAAAAQYKALGGGGEHTLADLNIVSNSNASLRAYGNAVMSEFVSHPDANFNNTFLAVGNAIDAGSAVPLQQLLPIKAAYVAIAAGLLAMPVPQTLAPFHLLVVNDFERIANSYDDMRTIVADPLRGAVGFKNYQSTLSDVSRVFTNIALTFSKDGILFTKDEPGNDWSNYLAPTGSPQ